MLALIVGGKAFQITNGYGLATRFEVDAARFALFLLRTYATADGRQGARFAQCGSGFEETSALNVLDKARDIDVHGATLHAAGIVAVQAARGLAHGFLHAQSLRHLFAQFVGAITWLQFVHLAARCVHTFAGLLGGAKGYAPSGIAALVLQSFAEGSLGGRNIFGCLKRGGLRALRSILCHVCLLVGHEACHFGSLLVAESTHALQHFVEIHLVAVKLGTIHADELGLSAHRDAAGAAHTRAVHHNRVERNVCGNVVFLGQQTNKLHHNGGADGKALVHLLALNHLLDTLRDQTLLAVRPIICHNNHLVGRGTHLALQDNQFLGAACQHRHDAVASSLERTHNRQEGCHAHTTASTNNGAEVFDVCGLSQGAHHIGNVVAFLERTEFCRGNAHLLHNQGDGALCRVGVRDGEGDTFATFIHTDNDEMTSTP